jgi:two-component system OmpR family sensor kinase
MTPIQRFRSIPVSYRVPLLVAALMIVISAVISERVLDRLSRTQESFLNGLAETYLDGLSSAVVPAVLREDVWEVFDVLDRSSSSNRALAPVETVVTGADGRVLAASDPNRIATFSELPSSYLDRYGPATVTIDRATLTGLAHRDLIYQGQHIGAIHATFDVSHLFAERREVLVTLLATNCVLAILFALAGFALVKRMIGPMRVLEDHMGAAAKGAAEPISMSDIPSADPEVANLFRRYNALVHAERERASFAMQLAEEEKLASLGRLASGMAHEINNPLGGLFNALDTLKKHGEMPGVRETSINLIERGLAGIRDVVQAALSTYRPTPTNHPLSLRDFEDVNLLLKPELTRRRQKLRWDVSLGGAGALPVRGGPVRQAVLNLLLNASAVTPERGTVTLSAKINGHSLQVEVGDEGTGMPSEIAGILTDADPTPTVRAGRGLGLWMVRRVIDELLGSASIVAKQDKGTAITLTIPLDRENSQVDAA